MKKGRDKNLGRGDKIRKVYFALVEDMAMYYASVHSELKIHESPTIYFLEFRLTCIKFTAKKKKRKVLKILKKFACTKLLSLYSYFS